MPFGETFVEQRSTTSFYTPYTFSAKERDTETGYSVTSAHGITDLIFRFG
jgi:hypothetical protein